jgi:hypothetical protein
LGQPPSHAADHRGEMEHSHADFPRTVIP